MNLKLVVFAVCCLFFGCQKSSNPTSSNDVSGTPPKVGPIFYGDNLEILTDCPDSSQFYTFQLKLDFDKSLYNWPKVNYGSDNIEVNAASVSAFVTIFYGDSLKIKSDTKEIVHLYYLDSLLYLKNGLSKNYQIKISKDEFSQYPLTNQHGPINMVISWVVCAGYIQDETNYDVIKNRLSSVSGTCAYFLPVKKQLINLPFN
ncbi:MAG: hypothetical protein ACM3SM_04970 [Bacteroidota bacterium]